MRLPDDAIDAVWHVFDVTGIRPEYLLPVLYLESGFNPTLQNTAGAPYYGIAQTSGAYIAQDLHMTPQEFTGAGAAAQIELAVLPHMTAIAKRYGVPRSATRAYQANFLPATLATARGLSQIVVPFSASPTSVYQMNRVLDPFRHGAILVSDLAYWMTRQSAQSEVKDAVARAYMARPSEGPPHEAVYGEDFTNPLGVAVAVVGLAAAAAALSR